MFFFPHALPYLDNASLAFFDLSHEPVLLSPSFLLGRTMAEEPERFHNELKQDVQRLVAAKPERKSLEI